MNDISENTAVTLVEKVWLTTEEACVYTGRHEVTVRRAAADGRLQSAQAGPGCPYRFRAEWLDAWISRKPAQRRAS